MPVSVLLQDVQAEGVTVHSLSSYVQHDMVYMSVDICATD